MTTRVTIARGDSHTFTGTVRFEDGTIPPGVESGSVDLYVTLKGGSTPVVAKSASPAAGTGAFSITLVPADTRALQQFAEYQVEFRYVNGSTEDQFEFFTLDIRPSYGAPAA